MIHPHIYGHELYIKYGLLRMLFISFFTPTNICLNVPQQVSPQSDACGSHQQASGKTSGWISDRSFSQNWQS